MTEWIVDNITEAFEKKLFPTYKEIFDLFTRVFSQSRQVSVPMDILRMALYERVRGNMPIVPVEIQQEEPIESVDDQEEEEEIAQVPAVHPTDEEKTDTHEIQTIVDDGIFTVALFLKRLEEAGIKSTLIPLLKTAHMRIEGDTIEIQTTGFCKSKCMETNSYQILENVAQSFHTKKIDIIVPNDIQPETSPPEESIEDVARSLFE